MRIHTLVILAAGLSRRYGQPKPLVPVGPHGEVLIDYSIHDAARAGIRDVVVITRPELRGELERHLSTVWQDVVSFTFLHQTLTDLPAGTSPNPNRVLPWGTAHAVLTARAVVHGPFTVINCDDYYGRDAYVNAGLHIRSSTAANAVVGYQLDETLSPSGGVSRAECEIGPTGLLERLTEYLNVRRVGLDIVGVTPDGRQKTFAGSEKVSMNCWVFQPNIFDELQHLFVAFLEKSGDDTRKEFFLSSAVNELIASRRCAVAVLPTTDQWIGITYPEDHATVVAALAKLTARGYYPRDIASIAAPA